MSPMAISGIQAATVHTKSHSPSLASMRSTSWSAMARSRSSWSRTRRRVNPVLTRRRRWLCSGSSIEIIMGTCPVFGRMFSWLLKTSGVREACLTSSYRVSAQTSAFGS